MLSEGRVRIYIYIRIYLYIHTYIYIYTHTHVSIDAQVGTTINVMVSGDLVNIGVDHTNLQSYDDLGR